MTRDKFKRLLEEMERYGRLNESEMPDFIETCRRLLIYHLYAYDIMKLRPDKAFEDDGGIT